MEVRKEPHRSDHIKNYSSGYCASRAFVNFSSGRQKLVEKITKLFSRNEHPTLKCCRLGSI